ncbi:hydantoin utilization protein A [Roseovarius faecimaris]|uniref:Hydantoin utilization protein A n=1 Tax=Roseovarius faecimaris TaxID=2494550 RepID=A0A6I6IU50_9RHOB|nr:HupE/UreJ family protein [Roseovarius faecimaris]QGX99433.1 hydantoin utilization protein A [Roseovarius faecimaris]
MKTPLASLALLAIASPAFAHHPLDGMPMQTVSHGLLSGLGHSILGFDHLFFVIAVGVAALFTANRFLTPAAYIAAMLLGCALMSAGIGLPVKEAMIALSLLGIGAVLMSGRALGPVGTLLVFAGFGLFHGSAFGDSLATQESTAGLGVLMGYLVGLGVVQYLIAVIAGHCARAALNATRADAVNTRLIGAVVAGVGLFLCLERLEGPVLALLIG